ncbi:MAG TPA: arylesterase, partial [Segetibacter sp.]
MTKLFVLGSVLSVLLLTTACKSNQQPNDTSDKKVIAKGAEADNKVKKTILFFGNSLTAGLGVEPTEAFPALIGEKIDSAHLGFKVVNAGVSGETSAGGNGRIDWILKQPVDVFVLELGANDGLRGVPVAETRKNLQSIIDKVKAKYPKAKLVMAGMRVPPNMGEKYAEDFHKVFEDLAEKNNMALVPFLLEGVGGVKELNQQDGIHPTAE